jgi:hypothetical protein
VLTGSPPAALAATATGELLGAVDGGDVVLLSVLSDSALAHSTGDAVSMAAATTFLESTSEVPDDGDLDAHLVMTDGTARGKPRIWQQ